MGGGLQFTGMIRNLCCQHEERPLGVPCGVWLRRDPLKSLLSHVGVFTFFRRRSDPNTSASPFGIATALSGFSVRSTVDIFNTWLAVGRKRAVVIYDNPINVTRDWITRDMS